MAGTNRPVVAVVEQSNAYQSLIIEGIRMVLRDAGTSLLVVSRDPLWTSVSPSLRRALIAVQPVGVIVAPLADPLAEEAVRALLADKHGLATVYLGASPAQGSHHCSTIHADNATMREVARHVVTDCGARRPVMLRGHQHQVDSREREQAVREELADLGCALDEELVLSGAFDRDRARREMRALLEHRRDFDAVIAFNDRMALGAIDALQAAGLSVPHDVVVTGFDDEDVTVLCDPPLTSVSQQLTEQGALAARLLLAQLDGARPTSHVVPTRLIVRGTSTRRAPAAATQSAATQADALPECVSDAEKDVPAVMSQLWREVSVVDTSLAMTRGFTGCHSAAEVVDRLAQALPRLGVRRCFFVLFYQVRSAHAATTHPDARLIGRMVLAQRSGELEPVGSLPPFEVSSLLPEHLGHELTSGTLMLQPLSTERGELGYLLLDLEEPDRFIGDALRGDLCRTLDLLARNVELAEYAQDLERLVNQRTGQLQTELATRRAAEEALRQLNDDLRLQLHVDGLTGLTNRTGFDERLSTHWSAHSRANSPLSLLMVDVDHFKRFNDTYGHLAGDECLRTVARSLRASVRRPNDVTARFGGEEFAVILTNTDPPGALFVAERVRARLAEAAIAHTGSPHELVTVSIGVATAYPDPLPSWTSLIADADVALYAAKAAGRDRVVAAEGGLLTG